MSVSGWMVELAERGWLPDAWVRRGIRRRLEARLGELRSDPDAEASVVAAMTRAPMAIAPDVANEQHYELPPDFFQEVLGPRLKYSCCYWPQGVDSLAAAEEAALAQAVSRAGIEDGMRVLDLGCGWGSLALWIAERFPACRVTAVSNSAPQGELIRERARQRGLDGLAAVTADMNRYQPSARFDRIVSVEMFEHMRNWGLLAERLESWLAPGGKLFAHHFCHRERPYFFEVEGSGDWMSRHFFTGGLMPSERLLERFAGPLALERRWRVGGVHYERTLLAWLERMDRGGDTVRGILAPVYGADSERWFHRWRLFFLACAELFAYRGGEEWFVAHSLWSRARDLESPTGGSPA